MAAPLPRRLNETAGLALSLGAGRIATTAGHWRSRALRASKITVACGLTAVELVTISGCGLPAKQPANLPRTATEVPGAQAGGAGAESPAITKVRPGQSLLPGARLVRGAGDEPRSASGDYRIGEEDELKISVYGDDALDKTQIVRPGGKISFPFIGEIMASGLTAGELSAQLTERLARYVKDPGVTVIVSKYNSKKISVLGQVRVPGLLRLVSDVDLLQGVAIAGGLTENADLQGALLVRDAQIVPVDFVALFKRGDLSQNLTLHGGDVVLIPNIQDKKVFVLGEVSRPHTLVLRPGVTLLEAVAQAGGFTRDAKKTSVMVVRGGLADPTLLTVDIDKLTRGEGPRDMALEPGDVVYVPRTFIADVVRFFQNASAILGPVVLTASGIVLGSLAKGVFTGTSPGQPSVVTPTQ